MQNVIPPIGFGTYKHLGDICLRSVSDALEIGYRHIDTAEMYGNEREVGKAIAASAVKRSDIWITTKVPAEALGPGQVLPHAKTSLERLGVDKVDLLLIHWPSIGDQYVAEDYIAQLGEVKAQGLATQIGVSNFTKKYIDIALRVLGPNYYPIRFALYTAYVILLKNMLDLGKSMSPKPVTRNTLSIVDNLCSAIVVTRGSSI